MAIRRKSDKENAPERRLRISVIDDDSHEQLFGFKTTKTNLIVVLSAIIVAAMALTYCLTAFTPLRHSVPGYPSTETRMAALDNMNKVDSLESIIEMWALQVSNIQRIVNGQEPLTPDSQEAADALGTDDAGSRASYAATDSILREEIRKQEAFNVPLGKSRITQIEGMHFFKPVNGVVAKGFDEKAHAWLDIAAGTETNVYATLDGTVIAAYWTDEYGYVITIQHESDLISTYRHTVKLLKGTGDRVTAGTPIALVSDVATDGAHLFFELWHKGEPVDPQAYIKF